MDVDFSANLDTGEVIIASSSGVTAKNGTTDTTATVIEAGSLTASGGILYFRVQAGADGETHHLTVTGVTDKGNILEQDIDLIISEI